MADSNKDLELFNNFNEYLIICDKDFKILFLNNSIKALLNFEHKDSIELKFNDIFNMTESNLNSILESINNGKKETFATSYKSNCGVMLELEVKLWSVNYCGVDLIYVLVNNITPNYKNFVIVHKILDDNPYFMNTTSLHNDLYENILKNHNDNEFEDLENIFINNYDVGIWKYDIVEQSLYWSKNLFAIFELEEKDFKKDISDWFIRIYPEDLEKIVISYNSIINNSKKMEKIEYFYRILKENGKIHYIKSNGKIVYKDNSPIAIIGVSSDITKRVNIEFELTKQKEKSEIEIIMKNKFLASFSHELRTPLNGIIGYLDILKKTNLDKEQAELVDDAKISSDMLIMLLNDILDLSKFESGKFELENKSFNLESAIESSISTIKSIAYEKNIPVNLFIDENVPQFIVGDSDRLKQILNNILSNSAKFTNKGKIDIIVKCDYIKDMKVRLFFKVIDSGIGMSDHMLKKLFDPFIQADSTISNKFGGTGLGMSICKELVYMMSGNIFAESVEGEGTTIKFDIMVNYSNEKNRKHQNKLKENNILFFEDNNQISDTKILIVDDNETNQNVLCKMLNKYNYSCDIASNGIEALELVEKNDYNIIFMDCQMPKMDGYECSKKIRKLDGAKKLVKIVAMTANALEGDKEKCLNSGMDDYISKPVNYNAILNILEDSKKELSFNLKYSIEKFIKLTGINEISSREIFEDYIKKIPKFIEEIEIKISDREYKELASISHKLKGSSGNLGLTQLYKIFVMLEDSSIKNNFEDCIKCVEKIKEYFKLNIEIKK